MAVLICILLKIPITFLLKRIMRTLDCSINIHRNQNSQAFRQQVNFHYKLRLTITTYTMPLIAQSNSIETIIDKISKLADKNKKLLLSMQRLILNISFDEIKNQNEFQLMIQASASILHTLATVSQDITDILLTSNQLSWQPQKANTLIIKDQKLFLKWKYLKYLTVNSHFGPSQFKQITTSPLKNLRKLELQSIKFDSKNLQLLSKAKWPALVGLKIQNNNSNQSNRKPNFSFTSDGIKYLLKFCQFKLKYLQIDGEVGGFYSRKMAHLPNLQQFQIKQKRFHSLWVLRIFAMQLAKSNNQLFKKYEMCKTLKDFITHITQRRIEDCVEI